MEGIMTASEKRMYAVKLASEVLDTWQQDKDWTVLGKRTGVLMPKSSLGSNKDVVLPGLEGPFDFSSYPRGDPDPTLVSDCGEDDDEEIPPATNARAMVTESVAAGTSGTSGAPPAPANVAAGTSGTSGAPPVAENAAAAGSTGDVSSVDSEDEDEMLDPPVPVMAPFNEDDDEVVNNTQDAAEELADDTISPCWGEVVVPKGRVVMDKAEVNMGVSWLIGRRILFGASLTAAGTPGWITGTVQGGPADPSDKSRGITMRVRWSRRMDPNVHRLWLALKIVDACFELDAYGVRWYVLKDV
jgi:hypothetical protein